MHKKNTILHSLCFCERNKMVKIWRVHTVQLHIKRICIGVTFLCISVKLLLTLAKYGYSSSSVPKQGKLASFQSVNILLKNLPFVNLSDYERSQATASELDHKSTKLILRAKNNADEDMTWNSTKVIRPENITSLPGKFLTWSKNPCWIADENQLLCLPYFYLAGMPKCGTTDIWDKISEHPNVVATGKETHWWSRIRIGKFYGKSSLTPCATSYYARWGRLLLRESKVTNAELSELIIGDGSASTFWDHRYWREFYPSSDHGPPYTTPSLIRSIQPHVKVIIALRNPVERLYSDFFYVTKGDTNKTVFHRAVEDGIKEFMDCVRKLDERSCTHMVESTQYQVRLRIGLFSVYLRDWLKVFPGHQLFIIRTEDWSGNCSLVLQELFRFLEIDTLQEEERIKFCQVSKSNVRSVSEMTKGSMLPETKQILKEFYAPFNERLADMLNDRRFLWNG